jgi:hypothetical protein
MAMEFERIEVFTRDDYRGSQEPLAFEWRGKRYEVAQVVDRWYEGSVDSTRVPLRYFRVKTFKGEVFIIRYHEFFTAWSLLLPHDIGESTDKP